MLYGSSVITIPSLRDEIFSKTVVSNFLRLISPKKYGKELTNIPLLDKPQPQTIYNKIVKNSFEATKLFIEPPAVGRPRVITQRDIISAPTITEVPIITEVVRTEYIPIFFTNNNISISKIESGVTVHDSTEEVIFSPGKWRFILSPFDNILKIKVFTDSSLSDGSNPLVPLDLNVNSAKYRLVFETDSGKISVDNVNDSNLENLSTGQLTFNISKKDSRETLMYSGEWRRPSEQADVDLAIVDAKARAASQKSTAVIFEDIRTKLNTIESWDITNKFSEADTRIQDIGVAPLVNRFGVTNAKSIRTDLRNTRNTYE